MKRIIRDRRLTPEEAAKYKAIRQQVAEELPDLIARHHERMASLDQLQAVHRMHGIISNDQRGRRICFAKGGNSGGRISKSPDLISERLQDDRS